MLAKIVLLGEGAVGKSTIRERYLGIAFRPAYLQTVGADYTIKNQPIIDGKFLQLQIWDLAGQKGFFNIRKSYYKGTDGAILVFDVSKPETAEKISDWVREIKNNISKQIPMILVGNKIDLRPETNSMTSEQGELLAKQLSKEAKIPITYIESSAKTGENLDSIFSSIANAIVDFKNRREKRKKNDSNFDTYYNEVKDHIDLYFFKMMEDGPACVSQTASRTDPELQVKMAIFYATALGQGNNANTGLFGPLPIPETTLQEKTVQSLIFSFKKTDKNNKDERMKKANFCFIVITIEKDLMYQFNNDNSINRFFFNELDKIEDADQITKPFLFQLKQNLLNDVFIINNPS